MKLTQEEGGEYIDKPIEPEKAYFILSHDPIPQGMGGFFTAAGEPMYVCQGNSKWRGSGSGPEQRCYKEGSD
jgi:hypothetical protein